MRDYDLTHLSSEDLLRNLNHDVSTDHESTALRIAQIGEADARRLYVEAGYPSMHAYCVDKFNYTDDATYKRIQIARAARQFPQLYHAIADGRLHLTGARTLAPYLTAECADELIAAASRRTARQIEALLMHRFARPGRAVFDSVTAVLPSPAPLLTAAAAFDAPTAPAPPVPAQQVSRPLEHYRLEMTIDGEMREELEYAQSLLGHGAGEPAKILRQALKHYIALLEKRKFAATDRPRRATASERTNEHSRYVPAHAKRTVWERDGGRCTFVTADGVRCPARKGLEFDHIVLFARGGESTVENLRLRCRVHNQYEAEQALGENFMAAKRAEARRGAAPAMPPPPPEADETAQHMRDVYSALRNLGCPVDRARRGAEHAGTLVGATIEERIRAALQSLGRKPQAPFAATGLKTSSPPVAAGFKAVESSSALVGVG